MLLESQISSQPLAKRLILNFFHQSVLSRDAYDRALGRDVINGRSKLTSQRQFASVWRRAKCIASVIASSTVEGSLGPFDCDKARQNITRAPGYLHTTERQNSLLRLWSAICFKIMTRSTCGFFPRILAIIPATRYTCVFLPRILAFFPVFWGLHDHFLTNAYIYTLQTSRCMWGHRKSSYKRHRIIP